MSDVHTGAVCLPLITDLFTKQGLGKAFLVQIDDENPAGEFCVLEVGELNVPHQCWSLLKNLPLSHQGWWDGLFISWIKCVLRL